MTFSNFVLWGYAENSYNGCDNSPKEQYYLHADGRDEGLRDINADAPRRFIRGSMTENRAAIRGRYAAAGIPLISTFRWWKMRVDYFLFLAGDAWNRTIETVKFYPCSDKSKYPGLPGKAYLLADRLAEKEKIGIVPEGVFPSYCESLFPGKNIIDYMNCPTRIGKSFCRIVLGMREKTWRLLKSAVNWPNVMNHKFNDFAAGKNYNGNRKEFL